MSKYSDLEKKFDDRVREHTELAINSVEAVTELTEEIERLQKQLLAEQERVKALVDLVEESYHCSFLPRTPFKGSPIFDKRHVILSPPPVVGPRQDAD